MFRLPDLRSQGWASVHPSGPAPRHTTVPSCPPSGWVRRLEAPLELGEGYVSSAEHQGHVAAGKLVAHLEGPGPGGGPGALCHGPAVLQVEPDASPYLR